MIIESLTDLFFYLIEGALSAVDVMGVPLEWLTPLVSLFNIGIWVVGADTMAVFAEVVTGWWLINLTVGVIVWAWELLPFT